MEEVEDNEISKFVGECKKYPFYKSIDLKTVAIRVDDDRWVNIATRVKLLPEEKTTPEKEELLKVDDFAILQKIMSADQLEDLIKSLKEGTLKFDLGVETPPRVKDKELDFKFIKGERMKEDFSKYGFLWGESLPEEFEWKIKGLASLINSMDIFDERIVNWKKIEKINLELKCHKEPYENLTEATKEFLGEEVIDLRGPGFSTYPYIRIIAPIYVRIEQSKFEKDLLNVEVKCHKSIEPKDLKLGWILHEVKTIRRQDVFCDDETIEEKEWFYKLRKLIKTYNAPSVQFYLFLNDELVDKAYKSKEVTTVKPEKVGSSEQTPQPATTINIDAPNSIVQVAAGKYITQNIEIESKEIIKQIIDAIQKSSELNDKKKEELVNEGQKILKIEEKSFYTKLKKWLPKVKEVVKDNKEIMLLVMQLIILLKPSTGSG